MPEFGRLSDVPMREAWLHEARAFTPWLAENLSQISEAVGIRLQLEGREVAVGRFAADILARNLADDSRVLIENQLERTDHTHLGQILTYLAGLQANTVIWIAPEFREEHLSAVKWLNSHTSEECGFFAVRVKVVRIGNSPLAPVFEVLERPNEWERELQAAAPVHGARSERRLAFWTAYLDRYPLEAEADGPAGAQSYRWKRISDVGLVVSMFINEEGYVGVFIRGPRGFPREDTWTRLQAHRVALEAELPASMGEDRDFAFIQRLVGDPYSPIDQPRLIEWLYKTASHYERVLRENVPASTM